MHWAASEVDLGFEMDAENIREQMMDKLKRAQEASHDTSGDSPSGSEAPEAGS